MTDIKDFPSIEEMNDELRKFYDVHSDDIYALYDYFIENFQDLVKHNEVYAFKKAYERVSTKINGSIQQKKDASEYGLSCTGCCSRGYCSCDDLVPYINTRFMDFMDPIDNKHVSMNEDEEEVYVLSDSAIKYSDYSSDEYAAWTISKIFVDDMEYVWDETDEQIEKMIVFENIKKI